MSLDLFKLMESGPAGRAFVAAYLATEDEVKEWVKAAKQRLKEHPGIIYGYEEKLAMTEPTIEEVRAELNRLLDEVYRDASDAPARNPNAELYMGVSELRKRLTPKPRPAEEIVYKALPSMQSASLEREAAREIVEALRAEGYSV